MIPVPKDKQEAIAAIAELDAARWGESERAVSMRLHGNRSYGLLLNSLAHRPEYGYGDLVPHLVAAAEAAMTAEDRETLRKGG